MSQMLSNDTPFTPLSPEIMQEPSVGYDFLHKHPVYLCEEFEPPFYILSRHEDVTTALRNIQLFSSEFGQGPRFTPPTGMLSDPPQHTFFRSLVQQALTPKVIGALKSRLENLALQLLLERDTRSWDLHDDFGFPLPVIIISEILGVPAQDIHHFKQWSDASVAAMGAEDPSDYATDMAAMTSYLQDAIGERRQRPEQTDLIASLVHARTENGEQLDDASILSVITQLLVGGNETTTSLITNATWRLLQQPDLWRAVCAEPARLVPQAIEESLRFDPPVLGLYRNTTASASLHNVEIPENSKVMLHYAAANRDNQVYPDANVFRLDRPSSRHLAFGLGVHFCLGAHLARLEASICLQTLAKTCPELHLTSDSARIAPFFLWGRRHLPVAG